MTILCQCVQPTKLVDETYGPFNNRIRADYIELSLQIIRYSRTLRLNGNYSSSAYQFESLLMIVKFFEQSASYYGVRCMSLVYTRKSIFTHDVKTSGFSTLQRDRSCVYLTIKRLGTQFIRCMPACVASLMQTPQWLGVLAQQVTLYWPMTAVTLHAEFIRD